MAHSQSVLLMAFIAMFQPLLRSTGRQKGNARTPRTPLGLQRVLSLCPAQRVAADGLLPCWSDSESCGLCGVVEVSGGVRGGTVQTPQLAETAVQLGLGATEWKTAGEEGLAYRPRDM
ncbi:hypothetical protein QBC45DRAFT_487950 [Copromyces sp. CBS 386.78]|nr:hypothetical protein QBC45DRAFT_487950 [Copromyces sp. CBS 386.78]